MHKQPHLTLLRKISFLFLIPLLTVSALYAANPLSVELLLPKQKTSNGAVTIVMTNTSDKDIKILKWNTPLEKNLNANIFTIKNNKSTIKYVGVLVKRSKPTEEDYLLFKAGEKRTVTVDLPTYYQMEKEGSYTVTYHGSFKQKTPSKNKITSKKLLKTSHPSVTISFTPTQKKVVSYSQKISANFNACSTDQISILNNAHDASIVIARDASDTMDSAEANTEGERYSTWFGAANNTRQTTVKTHLNNIYNTLENEQVTFDCDCSAVDKSDETFAYVYPNQPYTIHICGAFWNAELTGTDSQAGTIVHETSHFTVVAGTDDHVYGQAGAKELAISAPENAIQNADSHEFFAENTPALTMNDPFATAEFIRGIENINLSGTIAAAGDKTIYVFSAPRTGSYTFYTSGSLDTQGTLYNASRSVISYNDDMNTTAEEYNFKITAKLVQGQTYYLKVNAYGTNTGDYTLISTYTDTIKPTITLLGEAEVTLEVNTPYIDAGATANDNIDGNISSSISIVNNVNTQIPGTYTVTYDVNDTKGNVATQVTRSVTVIEVTMIEPSIHIENHQTGTYEPITTQQYQREVDGAMLEASIDSDGLIRYRLEHNNRTSIVEVNIPGAKVHIAKIYTATITLPIAFEVSIEVDKLGNVTPFLKNKPIFKSHLPLGTLVEADDKILTFTVSMPEKLKF
jgi:peptidyl-Lys metalloendopeptidase